MMLQKYNIFFFIGIFILFLQIALGINNENMEIVFDPDVASVSDVVAALCTRASLDVEGELCQTGGYVHTWVQEALDRRRYEFKARHVALALATQVNAICLVCWFFIHCYDVNADSRLLHNCYTTALDTRVIARVASTDTATTIHPHFDPLPLTLLYMLLASLLVGISFCRRQYLLNSLC